MAVVTVFSSCYVDTNAIAGGILCVILTVTAILTSVVASRSPTRGPYVQQLSKCHLQNSNSYAQDRCLLDWCANSAHWSPARCSETNGLSKVAFDPRYNKRFLSRSFPLDVKSSPITWSCLALLAICIIVQGSSQVMAYVNPQRKLQQHRVSKRYRILLLALSSFLWVVLIMTSIMVLTGSVLASKPWGLYNTSPGLWVSTSVFQALGVIAAAFYHFLCMKDSQYIKEKGASGSILPVQQQIVNPTATIMDEVQSPSKSKQSFVDDYGINGISSSEYTDINAGPFELITGSPAPRIYSPLQVLSSEVFGSAAPPPKPDFLQKDLSFEDGRFNPSPVKEFKWEELNLATNGFSNENVIGQGGFGKVYKGQLKDGSLIAVKRLHALKAAHGSSQFKAEVEIISRVHHRNLVSLQGFCLNSTEQLLVFEFLPNGSLEDILMDGLKKKALDWQKRFTIALGAARGLSYLHNDCSPKIVHRDIKASNILLDVDFFGKVADFGLARLLGDKLDHVTTRVMGTIGYLAPDYAFSGQLTQKSDVFSFGVVLLELVTGRKPIQDGESLVEWAWQEESDHADPANLADPCLMGQFSIPQLTVMWKTALQCIRHVAQQRPDMEQVFKLLNEHQPSQESSVGKPFSAPLDIFSLPDLPESLRTSPDTNVHTHSVSVNTDVVRRKEEVHNSVSFTDSFVSNEGVSGSLSTTFKGLLQTAKEGGQNPGDVCAEDLPSVLEQANEADGAGSKSEAQAAQSQRIKVMMLIEEFESLLSRLEKEKKRTLEEEWRCKGLHNLGDGESDVSDKIEWWSGRLENLRKYAATVRTTSLSDSEN